MTEDQRPKTREHIATVQKFMHRCIDDLEERASRHDASKLDSPEREIFDEYTPKLRSLTYGSDEYTKALKGMSVALEHHYASNSHHPEHHIDGIAGMNLMEIIEMLMDWKAATLRHADGDIRKSLEINQKRFGYSDDLKRLMTRTIDWLDATEEE